MYYGNSECGNQQNATGVWDSKYKLVQHLDETSGTQYDSTSNDNDVIAYNGVTQDATGQIDGADEFDGSNDYVERSYDPDFTPGLSSWTVEAWGKSPSGSTTRAIVYWYRCGANPECYIGDGARYSLSISSDNKASWMVRDDDGNGLYLNSAAPVGDNSWHHLVGTFDPSADLRKLYVDGYEVNTSSIALTSLSDGGINIPLEIGRAFITGWESPQYYFNGTIDEVRISAIARSGNWINTCYCN